MGKKLLLLAIILVSAGSIIWNATGRIEMQARFQVAGIAHNDRIPFTVELVNTGNRSLSEYTIVATAGESVQHFDGPPLDPGEDGVVKGELVLQPGAGSVEFSARVIGHRCSYLSNTVTVARQRGLGGDGQPQPQLYSQQIIQQSNQQLVVPPMGELEAPALEELAYGSLDPIEPSEDVDQLIDKVENTHCNGSRQTLEIYQKMGNSKADEFLISSL